MFGAAKDKRSKGVCEELAGFLACDVAVRISCCHWRNETRDCASSWPLPSADMYCAGSTNWPFTIVEKCRCGPVERPVEPT